MWDRFPARQIPSEVTALGRTLDLMRDRSEYVEHESGDHERGAVWTGRVSLYKPGRSDYNRKYTCVASWAVSCLPEGHLH